LEKKIFEALVQRFHDVENDVETDDVGERKAGSDDRRAKSGPIG